MSQISPGRSWRAAVLSATVAAALAASLLPARADMSCQDFNRAAALNDADGLAEAREIVLPLSDAGNEVHTILNGPSARPISPDFYLGQLESDCQALPSDTVGIVATRMKGMERLKASAIASMKAAAAQTQQPVSRPPPRPAVRPGETLALTENESNAIGDHVRICVPSPHAGWEWYTLPNGNEAWGLSPSTMEILAHPIKITTDANGVVRKAEPAATKHLRPEEQQMEQQIAQQEVKAFLDPRCAKLPLPADALGRVNVFTLPLMSVWVWAGR